MRSRARWIALMVAFAAVPAPAQEIHWPRLGQPAVAHPGGAVEIEADAEGALSLVRDGAHTPLDAAWAGSPEGPHIATGSIPESLPPGRYDLAINGAVQRRAAVHVIDAVPETYDLAMYRGVSAATFPADLAVQINAARVHLVILTGPLVGGGELPACEALEAQLMAIEAPVFVCPADSDLRSEAYRERFGNRVCDLDFGADGFLFLGAGLAARDPRTHERLGTAHSLRRRIRASRWSIGVAGSYDLDWDLRAQVALFVDNPLDYLAVGAIPQALGNKIPWGTTLALPEAGPEALVLLQVTEGGIKPRPEPAPEQPAK